MPRIPNQFRSQRLSISKMFSQWKKSRQPKLIPASQSKIKAIMFDLDGVLCTTSTWKACNIIGWKIIFRYILDQWKFPNQNFLYQALAHIPAKNKIRSFATDTMSMPTIMLDWQCNIQSPEIITSTIMHHVTASHYSQAQKDFLFAVIELKMNPEKLIASRKIIPQGVQLLHELKNYGYQLYILSNWDFQSFPILKKEFPEIFTHDGKKTFDGMITSGQIGIAKPYHKIYQQLLTEYNLDPQQALFIDDVIENCKAAEKVGIQSIHCKQKNIKLARIHLANLIKSA